MATKNCDVPVVEEPMETGKPLITKNPDYENLTPWVLKLFFAHTYYAYVYTFYMFLLAYYKGYALEYPEWRRPEEMVLIMCIPMLQHIRFYFGHWGCAFGGIQNLSIFVFLCTVLSWVLMFFLFFQAYVLPHENTLLIVAIITVFVEGLCGVINALQPSQMQIASARQLLFSWVNIMLYLVTMIVFVVFEVHTTVTEETTTEEQP
mmetsp:Transcript_16867/g.45699  ORF Transcript_16867/g.45699 Transcript_16867/m.45699 type:complete len:205 (-) Transcript_16867:81-695(-)